MKTQVMDENDECFGFMIEIKISTAFNNLLMTNDEI